MEAALQKELLKVMQERMHAYGNSHSKLVDQDLLERRLAQITLQKAAPNPPPGPVINADANRAAAVDSEDAGRQARAAAVSAKEAARRAEQAETSRKAAAVSAQEAADNAQDAETKKRAAFLAATAASIHEGDAVKQRNSAKAAKDGAKEAADEATHNYAEVVKSYQQTAHRAAEAQAEATKATAEALQAREEKELALKSKRSARKQAVLAQKAASRTMGYEAIVKASAAMVESSKAEADEYRKAAEKAAAEGKKAAIEAEAEQRAAESFQNQAREAKERAEEARLKETRDQAAIDAAGVAIRSQGLRTFEAMAAFKEEADLKMEEGQGALVSIQAARIAADVAKGSAQEYARIAANAATSAKSHADDSRLYQAAALEERNTAKKAREEIELTQQLIGSWALKAEEAAVGTAEHCNAAIDRFAEVVNARENGHWLAMKAMAQRLAASEMQVSTLARRLDQLAEATAAEAKRRSAMERALVQSMALGRHYRHDIACLQEVVASLCETVADVVDASSLDEAIQERLVQATQTASAEAMSTATLAHSLATEAKTTASQNADLRERLERLELALMLAQASPRITSVPAVRQNADADVEAHDQDDGDTAANTSHMSVDEPDDTKNASESSPALEGSEAMFGRQSATTAASESSQRPEGSKAPSVRQSNLMAAASESSLGLEGSTASSSNSRKRKGRPQSPPQQVTLPPRQSRRSTSITPLTQARVASGSTSASTSIAIAPPPPVGAPSAFESATDKLLAPDSYLQGAEAFVKGLLEKEVPSGIVTSSQKTTLNAVLSEFKKVAWNQRVKKTKTEANASRGERIRHLIEEIEEALNKSGAGRSLLKEKRAWAEGTLG